MRSLIACLAASLALSTAALAADYPGFAAPSPERFGWTGFYLGGSLGYAWLRDVDSSFTPPLASTGEDVVFGVHAGYLHQFGNFVVGGEGELARLNIQFEGLPVYAEDAYSLRARFGYAFDRLLLTGHVGGSYVTTNIGLQDWALVVGAGVDYAVTDNITIGAQYNHMRSDGYDNTLIDARIDSLTARVGVKF